jgi:putative transposase
VAINHCWGVDLTGRTDDTGNVNTILGILDHGSRRALALCTLPRKCGWSLLGHLCFAVARFGRPRFIRTDNERCFTGRVFSTGLRLFGIHHQRINLHCPWMNGRVERFFGTLKKALKRCTFSDGTSLEAFLADFIRWHNEWRPHQNLGGMTPVEAWQGIDPFHAPSKPKAVDFIESWDGLLAGFRIRR